MVENKKNSPQAPQGEEAIRGGWLNIRYAERYELFGEHGVRVQVWEHYEGCECLSESGCSLFFSDRHLEDMGIDAKDLIEHYDRYVVVEIGSMNVGPQYKVRKAVTENENCLGSSNQEEAEQGGKMEEDKNNLTVFDAGEYGKYGEIHYLPGDTEIIMMATMLYMGYTKKLNITPQEFNRIAEVSAMVKAEHIEILLSYPTYSMEYWRLMSEMLGEIVKIVVEEDKEAKND